MEMKREMRTKMRIKMGTRITIKMETGIKTRKKERIPNLPQLQRCYC